MEGPAPEVCRRGANGLLLCGDLGARPDQKLAGALIIPKTIAPRIEILREAKERAFGMARVSSKLGDVIRRSHAKAKKGGRKATPRCA